MYVSSMRQLIHTGRLRRWNASSSCGLYLMTHRLICGVIYLHPTFFHESFDMARAQRIRHIPPHAHENDLLWEVGPLEAHRHRRSPSLCTIDDRERAYPKSPHMKIATQPLLSVVQPALDGP